MYVSFECNHLYIFFPLGGIAKGNRNIHVMEVVTPKNTQRVCLFQKKKNERKKKPPLLVLTLVIHIMCFYVEF